jgi:hypothetical protein
MRRGTCGRKQTLGKMRFTDAIYFCFLLEAHFITYATKTNEGRKGK